MYTDTDVYAAPGFRNSDPVFAPLGSGQGVGSGGGIKTILIVDDSMLERENLKGILGAADFQVLEADNGEQAIELAKTTQPDLVFLDIMMPGMDGFATCRSLHGGDETKAIPIIIVSSKANRSDKIWAEQMGAKGYITKPYTAEEIMEKIEQVA